MKDSTHTHPLDVGRLTVGLVFLGMVAVWLVIQVTGVDLGNAQWLFPVTLILAGVVGLAASGARGLVRSRSRRGSGEHTTYVDHHDDPPYYDLTSDLSEQLTRAEQEQRAARAQAPHGDDATTSTTSTTDTGTTDTDTSGEQR